MMVLSGSRLADSSSLARGICSLLAGRQLCSDDLGGKSLTDDDSAIAKRSTRERAPSPPHFLRAMQVEAVRVRDSTRFGYGRREIPM